MLVFNLTTVHLWGRVFAKFEEARAIAYADDGYMVLHLPHAEGGFRVTFNDVPKDGAFYTTTSRFLEGMRRVRWLWCWTFASPMNVSEVALALILMTLTLP